MRCVNPSFPRLLLRRRRISRQVQLTAKFFNRVKLHACHFLEDLLSPEPQVSFQTFNMVSAAQFVKERASHGMQDPYLHVCMQTPTTLSLDRSEVRSNTSKETPTPISSNTITCATFATARIGTQDMFDEQAHHEIEERGLGHRITSNTLQHLCGTWHRGRMLLQFPPALCRVHKIPSVHNLTFVQQIQHGTLGISYVRRRKHQGWPKQILVASVHVAQGRPVCIRANYVPHAE